MNHGNCTANSTNFTSNQASRGVSKEATTGIITAFTNQFCVLTIHSHREELSTTITVESAQLEAPISCPIVHPKGELSTTEALATWRKQCLSRTKLLASATK